MERTLSCRSVCTPNLPPYPWLKLGLAAMLALALSAATSLRICAMLRRGGGFKRIGERGKPGENSVVVAAIQCTVPSGVGNVGRELGPYLTVAGWPSAVGMVLDPHRCSSSVTSF